jgi:hypothetical protein
MHLSLHKLRETFQGNYLQKFLSSEFVATVAYMVDSNKVSEWL